MRLCRASLTHIFRLFDTIGHNNPWGSVQVVSDCLYDVLCVRLGQPHIPCYSGTEPSAHRAKSPFRSVARFAYAPVYGFLPFRQLAVLLRLVHDAAFQSHGGKRFSVFRRVVALVDHQRRTLF